MPARRNPTTLIPWAWHGLPSAMTYGGTSRPILAQPPMKAYAPTRENWIRPLTPPIVAYSPISEWPPTATSVTMMAPSPIRVSWPTWQVDMSRQLAPISVKPSGFVARWMVTYSRITVPAPTRTPEMVDRLNFVSWGSVPMMVPGPTRTPGPSWAFGSTSAMWWICSLTLGQLLDPSLQRAQPPQHLRELGLGDPDPEELGQRASIGAAELEAGRDDAADTRLRAQHGAISDADMIADSDLSAQDHASPDFARD